MHRQYLCIWIVSVMLLLSACSDSEQDSQHPESQEYYFLESLNLVEQAGRVLQTSDLDEGKVKQALGNMDRGLKLAFQVETLFLNSLDARLGKNYQRYFVKGVENYRLGIEARDRDQQQQGLELLGQWAKFWTAEQSAIKIKLNPG